jgi:hypothetical protein
MNIVRPGEQIISRVFLLIILITVAFKPAAAQAQEIRGKVFDPSGAVVPSANVLLKRDNDIRNTRTDSNGEFIFHFVTTGNWDVEVNADGFQPYSTQVRMDKDVSRTIAAHLSIQVRQEKIDVPSQAQGISVDPSENASALVLKGASIDALSDDPNELRDELQALAGPSAGPNGGEVYIDGFTGGHLPAKSSIKEIRINQNPFSAEFERLGYGSIEILTKPGGNKLSGSLASYGTEAVWNTGNPLVQNQPNYYFYFLQGSLSGPIKANASWFLNIYDFQKKTNALINAIEPGNSSALLREAQPNPTSTLNVSPRFDFQISQKVSVSMREAYNRTTQQNAGVGALNLVQQGLRIVNNENVLQASVNAIVNSRIMNETRFQWKFQDNSGTPSFISPAITVQGGFVDGGNTGGSTKNHRNDLEFQDYVTSEWSRHVVRFGVRLRSFNETNVSSANTNGAYSFATTSDYSAHSPYLYSQTVDVQPKVHAFVFDGSLFYQDDWSWKKNVTVSYGLRFEGQSNIAHHFDWAPRLAVAWAPNGKNRLARSTVIHVGAGVFHARFIGPSNLSSPDATLYWTQLLHNNGINQRNYSISNPDFYSPNSPLSPSELNGQTGASSYVYSISPQFHAAADIEGALTIDRQLTKMATVSVSYIYSRGTHQYLTNAVNAPAFDLATYTSSGKRPEQYNYQFESGGAYKEHQLITTIHTAFHRLGLDGIYAFTDAHSDTQGAAWFPSVSTRESADYGRASFAARHSVFLIGNISAPLKISLAPVIGAQSGVPYNVTTGSDQTENNQTNARPTYGVCGAADVVATSFGCLDLNPVGKSERVIPFNLGTGPSNVMVRLSVSRAFGIGPRVRHMTDAQAVGEGSVGGGLAGGGRQLAMGSKSSVPRRFNLTLSAVATNLVNYVNWGPPNGVLGSPLFGKSQSLATGLFESPSPGNRTIVFRAVLGF